VTLTPGDAYDFWYLETTGDPAELVTTLTQNTSTIVPEPGSLVLLGSAMLGFGMFYRRRNQA
jgi:PEP-CTERM motif